MLIARRSIAAAITPHAADRSWVVFLQTALPAGVASPIKIVAMRGADIGDEVRRIGAANAYQVQIIGLVSAADPDQLVREIAQRYAGPELHDGWYEASANLIAFIQYNAKAALHELLSRTHPAAVAEGLVDLKQMATILNCAEVTVRRMVHAQEIPFLRVGTKYVFHPAEVLAALRQHGR